MNATLIADIFLALGTIAKFPSINQDTVGGYLELLGTLIQQGAATDRELIELRNQIQQMVAEDREPTDAEWRSLKGLSAESNAIIQGWEKAAEELSVVEDWEGLEEEDDDEDPLA